MSRLTKHNHDIQNLIKRVIWSLYRFNTIFILGDGRSGTTWISDLINYDGRYIEVFEPFHGRYNFNLQENRIYPLLSDIKSISSFNEIIYSNLIISDRKRFNFPHGIIIKDISAHFILQYLAHWKFKNIFLIRNPLSVALSKESYGGWHSESDIKVVLNNYSELKMIGKECLNKSLVTTKYLEYVLSWCLLHRHTLKQLDQLGFFPVFYESVLNTPEVMIEKLFTCIGQNKLYLNNKKAILASSKIKSRTTTDQNRIEDNISLKAPWNKVKPKEEISKAYEIIKRCGLYYIYKDKMRPTIPESALSSIVDQWK